jgi:hypothetical protein
MSRTLLQAENCFRDLDKNQRIPEHKRPPIRVGGDLSSAVQRRGRHSGEPARLEQLFAKQGMRRCVALAVPSSFRKCRDQ